jgi:hypothetical protein
MLYPYFYESTLLRTRLNKSIKGEVLSLVGPHFVVPSSDAVEAEGLP